MDNWRASQPSERQLYLNHPRVVAAGWHRSRSVSGRRLMQSPVITTTFTEVMAWLAQASPADKRKVAVALAQDTALMKSILPTKALPRKATPDQVFRKAMGLLTHDVSPAH
jgi:hypothetical protein